MASVANQSIVKNFQFQTNLFQTQGDTMTYQSGEDSSDSDDEVSDVNWSTLASAARHRSRRMLGFIDDSPPLKRARTMVPSNYGGELLVINDDCTSTASLSALLVEPSSSSSSTCAKSEVAEDQYLIGAGSDDEFTGSASIDGYATEEAESEDTQLVFVRSKPQSYSSSSTCANSEVAEDQYLIGAGSDDEFTGSASIDGYATEEPESEDTQLVFAGYMSSSSSTWANSEDGEHQYVIDAGSDDEWPIDESAAEETESEDNEIVFVGWTQVDEPHNVSDASLDNESTGNAPIDESAAESEVDASIPLWRKQLWPRPRVPYKPQYLSDADSDGDQDVDYLQDGQSVSDEEMPHFVPFTVAWRPRGPIELQTEE